jgi:L-ascorbate metabolism protein UlaG (beta-lactamase superfamily)
MEVQFYGANCVRLVNKKAAITVDDNLAGLGLKSVTKAGDIALFTNVHEVPSVDVKLLIDAPGEFEVANVSVQGIAARAHMDEEDKKTATIFRIEAEDLRIVVLGHVHPDLTDKELEAIGTVDVLIMPVGGNGYTLDPIGALKVLKKIEPKMVIPTHYEDSAVKYEVPQQPLEEALKTLAIEAKETLPKIKLKSADLTETMQLVILERQ